MRKTKLEKLRLASAVAPAARSRRGARPVTIVNADGDVVRETTLAEVQSAALRRVGIEFGTVEDVRPETIVCANCRRSVAVRSRGSVPTICYDGCPCAGCGKSISRKQALVASRVGKPAACGSCATTAALTEKRMRGEVIGTIPYGYRSDNQEVLVEHPYEQSVIRTVANLHASGATIRATINALTELGMVSRSGKPFGVSQVHAIIVRLRDKNAEPAPSRSPRR